jgi:hypothetical protein
VGIWILKISPNPSFPKRGVKRKSFSKRVLFLPLKREVRSDFINQCCHYLETVNISVQDACELGKNKICAT